MSAECGICHRVLPVAQWCFTTAMEDDDDGTYALCADHAERGRTRSSEWCSFVYAGTDTDGTAWNRCTVHGDMLTMEGAYVCEGYEAPEYVEKLA